MNSEIYFRYIEEEAIHINFVVIVLFLKLVPNILMLQSLEFKLVLRSQQRVGETYRDKD